MPAQLPDGFVLIQLGSLVPAQLEWAVPPQLPDSFVLVRLGSLMPAQLAWSAPTQPAQLAQLGRELCADTAGQLNARLAVMGRAGSASSASSAWQGALC